MAISRQETCVLMSHPGVNLVDCHTRFQRSRKNIRICCDSNESKHNGPGQAHGLVAIEGLIPTRLLPSVMSRVLVDRVKENVQSITFIFLRGTFSLSRHPPEQQQSPMPYPA